MDAFRGHVVRCSHQRMGGGRFCAEESAQAQIAQFDNALAGDENIGRFDI